MARSGGNTAGLFCTRAEYGPRAWLIRYKYSHVAWIQIWEWQIKGSLVPED